MPFKDIWGIALVYDPFIVKFLRFNMLFKYLKNALLLESICNYSFKNYSILSPNFHVWPSFRIACAH